MHAASFVLRLFPKIGSPFWEACFLDSKKPKRLHLHDQRSDGKR